MVHGMHMRAAERVQRATSRTTSGTTTSDAQRQQIERRWPVTEGVSGERADEASGVGSEYVDAVVLMCVSVWTSLAALCTNQRQSTPHMC